MDLKIWAPLSCLSQSVLSRVRLAYVFGLYGHDALLVTEDDEVLACGSNKYCCLGLGVSHPSLSLRSVVTLRGKGVKGFSFGCGPSFTFMVATTNAGKVYAWGRRIGEVDQFSAVRQSSRVDDHDPPPIESVPKLVNFPCESIKITEVACGSGHCLALSMEGKVYSWGFNDNGELGNGSYQRSVEPVMVEGHLKNQSVARISCGYNFSVALLDNGKVFAWGDNKYGQIGLNDNPRVPEPIKIRGLNDVIIKDLVCGNAHVLVVTNVGSVYGWGKNSRSELGVGDNEPRFLPEIIPTSEKFVEIAASCTCSISAAMNDKSEVFRWGDFTDFYCPAPRKTPYKSLHEVFAQFASPRIMFKPVVLQSQSKSSNVPAEKKFNDETTSDLTILAEGKRIFVHREILISRSDYFRVFLQEHWVRKKQKVLDVIPGYEAMYSYLRYIYTGEIEADPDVAPELLGLADEYHDLTLKDLCEECLEFKIGINNVADLFALAWRVKATKLLERCITFAGCHISEVLLTPAVSKWDKDTLKEFIMQCHKKKLFRS